MFDCLIFLVLSFYLSKILKKKLEIRNKKPGINNYPQLMTRD